MLPGTAAETLLEPGPVRRLFAGFPALRHRNFRLFVVGQGISLVGYWMQSVAQGWLVYRLEGRPLDLAKVAFAGYLPILCLAPFAGVVADRLPRRPVLLVTQSLLGLLALVLGVLVWSGAVTVPLVVLFAGGVGLVSALDVPTRQSFLVEMASPEDLPNAIALNSSIFNGARLVGPALAGALVAALGEAPCFLLNAASYVAVLVALARMRLPPSQRPRPAQALGAGFLSGLRYVWGAPALRNLLLLLGVVSGLGVQYNLLMPVFARTVLGTNAFGFGLLHTAGGVGAIAAALQLAARRYSRAQHRRHLLLGLATFAARRARAGGEPPARPRARLPDARGLRHGALPRHHEHAPPAGGRGRLPRADDGAPHRDVPRHAAARQPRPGRARAALRSAGRGARLGRRVARRGRVAGAPPPARGVARAGRGGRARGVSPPGVNRLTAGPLSSQGVHC